MQVHASRYYLCSIAIFDKPQLTSRLDRLHRRSDLDMAVPNAKQQIPAVDVEREKMTRGCDGLLLSASDNHHNDALLGDKNGETTKLWRIHMIRTVNYH